MGYEDLNEKYGEMGGRHQVPSSCVNFSQLFSLFFGKIWK
ncbi:hypothetical protein ABOONEI_704 [Aciduliprofundum boonei T469]|nr:hypothetical protein ABOONEI_704 [Aciduliprofundum boonei T469]